LKCDDYAVGRRKKVRRECFDVENRLHITSQNIRDLHFVLEKNLMKGNGIRDLCTVIINEVNYNKSTRSR
jgi:hypothetical protein